ncbi:MAG TPA: hypothetical protein VL651_10720 [Bacteroidia bacterium]|jgi:hypothetical protein|nr:hypothetical protein [Bacteroidia bacterium]
MKALKLISAFACLSLLFMGCPYESSVPVDALSVSKSDPALVGVWRDTTDDTYQYKVTLDGSTYHIEKKNVKDATSTPTNYKGWLSDVSGSTFLNIYEVSDYTTDVQYYIYKVEKVNDLVKLRAVTDNITETFTTSAALKAYIKTNMGLSFFYNKDDQKVMGKTVERVAHDRDNEK